jgi:pyruvate kinase
MNTQIVVTLGPASRRLVAELRDAGATAFRLNAAHMSAGELSELAAAVRARFPDFPIIVDLQGAKMRLGDFTEIAVAEGDHLTFALSAGGAAIPLPHKEIFDAVEGGDTLSFDDDRLRFRIAARTGDMLKTVSLSEGTLRPRKGANVVEHPLALTDLTEADRARVRATAPLGGVSFAFSFMKDGQEAAWIRRSAPGCAVIGKIERREAAEQVHAIARLVDALWICRGDLGAQLGVAEMARWVGGYNPLADSCPVLMAGQVLEHMTAHVLPTRAEVCHLFDLVTRGYDGFVLSDETAVGVDPLAAVCTLRSLLVSFSR